MTGRYQHNTRVLNNTIAGNCSSPQWQETMEPISVGVQDRVVKKLFLLISNCLLFCILYIKRKAQDLGYKTFYAGKYLNQYGFKPAGGPEHVPKGWNEWLGLIGNSRLVLFCVSLFR